MERLSDTFESYDTVELQQPSYIEDQSQVIESDDYEHKQRPKLPSFSKKKNPTIQELEDIYDSKGYKSKEFCIYVRSLIFFVIRRYHGEPTEDLLNNCYLRLFELLSNFDRSKGNLGSFIFSICRNEITKYQYRLKKVDTELSVDISVDLDKNNSTNIVELNLDDHIATQQAFHSFDKIVFSDTFINDFSKHIIKCDLMTKVLLWEKVSVV